ELHQREQTKCPHPAICFREVSLPFPVQNVLGFERGVCPDVFDPACDFAKVEIPDALRALAVVALEPVKEIAGFIENDQLSTDIEDLVNAGMLRQSRQRFIVFDDLEPKVHTSL